MADVGITGFPSSYSTPGVKGEIVFNQGPSNAGNDVREIVLVMPKTAAGTWAVNTLYGPVRAESDVRSGGGAGSMAHRAYRFIARNNKQAKIYVVPYAETSTSTDVAADGTVTWSDDPTGEGTATLTVCGEVFSVGFDDDDTVTTIAEAFVAQINAADHLPVTADNSSGVLTLTAKIDGISQGDGTTGVIRYRTTITSGIGTTVAVSGAALGLGTGTAGVDGTTTEIANLTAALAVILSDRKYYIGYSAWAAGAHTAVAAHLAAKALPKSGRRSVSICATTGTIAAAATLATGVNYERMQIVNQPNSEMDVAALVGNMLAVRQKYEDEDPAFNFNGYNGREQIDGLPLGRDWEIPKAYASSDYPSDDDINDAILDGVTLIGSDNGGSYIAHSATTRSKNGSNNDSRSRSTHTVSGADDVMDTMLARITQRTRAKKLKDDQRLANGKIDPNQALAKRTITPGTLAADVIDVAEEKEAAGIIDDAQKLADTLISQIDPDNRGRVEIGFDFDVIAIHNQTTVRAAETTPG
jgi:phage tail sheath gpL-like